MSEPKLSALHEYTKENLAQGFMCRVTIPTVPLQLFCLFKNNDGSLHLCVVYQALNHITIHNQCTFPLIPELLAWFKMARIITKFDLQGACNLD